ncbi:MAG: hypothetical protein ACSHX9_10720 [Luteolibacter sp.]
MFPRPLFLSLFATVTCVSQANAAIMATISGGGGSPITITTSEPVNFTNVTTGLTSYGFALIGAASGNSTFSSTPHSGTMQWLGGTGTNSGTGNFLSSNLVDLSIEDVAVFWSTSGGSEQPVTTANMTLQAGFRVSDNNFNATVAQGQGSYEIRMINGDTAQFIGDAGTSIPEPALLALLGLGCAPLALRRSRC